MSLSMMVFMKTGNEVASTIGTRRLSPLLPVVRPRHMARYRLALLTALLAAAFLWTATPARAGAPAMSVEVHQASATVSSSYFRVDARPGTRQLAGTIQVFNRTDHPLPVRLNPVEGITANTLGSRYSAVGEPIHESAPWLRLGSPRVLVPAEGSRTVSVALEAPRSAQPGDFLSGVSVQAIRGSSAAEIPRSVVG